MARPACKAENKEYLQMKSINWLTLIVVLSAVFAPLAQAEEAVPRLKVALALGGGGTRGAAHVGVLKVFKEAGIPVDMIAGTSMGTIVGGLYAAGVPLPDIEQKFRDVSLMKSYMTIPIPVRILIAPAFATAHLFGWRPYDGLYFGNKFATYMNKSVPEDKRLVEKLNIPLHAVATNLVDGKPHVLSSGNFGRVMQASSAVPILRRPVEIDGKLFVDGAVGANVPVTQAKAMGADIVIAVNVDERVSILPLKTFRKVGSVSHRVMDLYLSMEDTDQLEAADIVIHPMVDGIGLISTNKKDAIKAMEAGEKAAREALPAILKKLSMTQTASVQ